MHETMIAESIFKQISEEAIKQNAKPVTAKISCGKLNAINEDVLGFAFNAIAKGTICENMKLIVEHKPLQAICKECNNNYVIDFLSIKCPNCQGESMELLPDSPLILEEVELEME
ncbi:MAG: hydrogenase maturation nickel metallochaperone HypA [Sedimentisphaerales bacterium]|nr:hydrogenase maturation nickel metallochaperone HypA [Sedimentisphaerales bacterium]